MLPAILDFLHIISAIRCMPDIARDFVRELLLVV